MKYKKRFIERPRCIFKIIFFSHAHYMTAFHALHTYTIILPNKETNNDHQLDLGLYIVTWSQRHSCGSSAFTGLPWLRCDWVWSVNKLRDEVSGSIDSSRLLEPLRFCCLEEMQLQASFWPTRLLLNTAATSPLISLTDMTLISLK